MAAKSKIDIDVNSAEFLEFKAKFDQYVDALEDVPESWKKIGQSTAVAKTNFESMAAGMAVVGASFAAITKSADEFYRVTTATSRYWKDLAVSTGSVAKNIVAATESLLKWTGIIGLVTGGGGLFGFDRLAHSVAGQRTAALGTGGDYGKRSAFLTAFKRFGDPEGLLSRVSEDQANFGRELRKLGLSEQDMKGDPADVALKAMRAGAKIAEADLKTGTLGIDPRLALFGSVEERRRLIALQKSGELEQGSKFIQENAGKLNLPPDIQRAYTDFVQKMKLAGDKIETIFAKGLVKLADPLGKLSQDVIDLAEKFTDKNGPLDAFITELSNGIEWLAGEINKPEFKKGVGDFLSDIGSLVLSLGGLVKGISDFAKWLGVSPSGTGALSGNSALPSALSSGKGIDLSGGKAEPGSAARRFGSTPHGAHGGGRASSGTAPGSTADAMRIARDQLIKEGVAPEHADAAAAALVGNAIAESGLDPNKVHDNGTGFGIYGARLGRRNDMLNWEREHGFEAGSLEGQQRYMVHEAFTKSEYAPTASALRNATDPVAVGRVVEHNFEAPQVENDRSASIKAAYSKKVTITSTPGGNAISGANAAAAGSP